MKALLRCSLFSVIVSWFTFVTAASAEPSAQVDLVMKDGTVLIGTITTETLSVQSAYGAIEVPTKNIISLEQGEIHLLDGSVLKVTINTPQIAAQTSLGALSVGISDIKTIRLHAATPAPAAAATSVAPEQTNDALPTAYGFYIVIDGKLTQFPPTSVQRVIGISLSNGKSVAVDGIPNVNPPLLKSKDFSFILYLRNTEPTQLKLAMLGLRGNMAAGQFNIANTRDEFFPALYGVSPHSLVAVNLWRPVLEIPMRVEPIEGKPDMYRLTPTRRFSSGNRYAIYKESAMHPGDEVFATERDRETNDSACYFGFEIPAAPPVMTEAEFKAQMGALPAPPTTAQTTSPKGKRWTCVFPEGLQPDPERSVETEKLSRLAVVTPGAKILGVDGNGLYAVYEKRSWGSRNATLDHMAKSQLERTDFQKVRSFGPVPIKISGNDGYAVMIQGTTDGQPFYYVDAFTLTKTHFSHLVMYVRADEFTSLWDGYKRFVASYKILAEAAE